MEFDEFLDGELAGLTRFAGVLTGDRQDAHDVLADALISARRRWSDIGGMDHPAAYVRRIVVTTFLARRRTESRRATDPTGDLRALDRAVEDPSATVEDRELMAGLLNSLAPRPRTALVLRYYLDYDDAAIAAALDTSAGAVRSLISRTLAQLRVSPDLEGVERP